MFRLLCCLALPACAPDLTPTWAADTVHVEANADGVEGFHTWTLYGPDWDKRRGERHHSCTLLFEVRLTGATEACTDCERTWTATESLTDSDCPEDLTWSPPTLSALGVGPVDAELMGAEPWPDATFGSWVRYDDGEWISHGWAIPEDPDELGLPLTGWPAWTWPVQP